VLFIEFFKGVGDKTWRVATPNKGPRPVPSLLSLILDRIKNPKKD
jgi:hypothetical protein